MPHDFLTDFLTKLQDAGELVRVAAPVDAALELAAIVDRVAKSPEGGPALFFENVKNSSIPVVANLLGSRRRLCLALGVDSLDQAAEKMTRLLQPESPSGWLDTLKLAPSFSGLARYAPRVIKTAVCQQVVKLGRDVNLWDLPIPRCWPDEANPVLMATQTVTHDPITNARRIERFPLQMVGQQQLLPHWHRYHGGWRHWQTAAREQKQLPVAISLGGDPLLTLMASAPLSAGADEYLFGGFLRGSSLDLVKGRSVELDVPAASEIIIEGYIDYASPLTSAPPIASGSGHYTLPEELPVIQVTAVTHRANPVLPTIVTGQPPSEESWISLALERLFFPIVKSLVPEIIDIHQPFSGAGRHLLFVSIHKNHPQQARRVLNALWGLSPFGTSKLIVIVDADVDLQREEDVWFAVGSHAHPGRDFVFCEGPTTMDDHAAPLRGIGHKVGIDATRKLSDEGHPRSWPQRLQHSEELVREVVDRWSDLGLSRY